MNRLNKPLADARQEIAVPCTVHQCGAYVVELGGVPGIASIRAGWRPKGPGTQDQQNVLQSFGVEMGNRCGFLTLEHAGLNSRILNGSVELTPDGYRRAWTHSLGPHQFDAQEELRISGDAISRSLQVTPLPQNNCGNPTPVFDVVLRWGWRRQFIESVLLAGREFVHRRRNLYHQYPVRQLTLRPNQFWAKKFPGGEEVLPITLRCSDPESPAGMKPHLYARDSAEGWIVHHRLFATEPQSYYVRSCNRWCRGAFSTPASFWHRFPTARRLFYLIRERRIPRFPFQLMGDAIADGRQPLHLEHELRFTGSTG